MKISTLIIWFNPDYQAKNNLLPYINIFEKIYIVDNSSRDNSLIIPKDDKVYYLPLHENLGIAKALNIGCKKAKEDGFDWALTMDQDSLWEENKLKSYINFCEQIINKYHDVKSIAAFPMMEHSVTYSILKKIQNCKHVESKNTYEFCDRCICSGNLIELNIWEKLKGFYEPLFIDDVDYEYCYKLRNAGYKIIQSNVHVFLHTIGTGKKTILPGLDKHGSFRLYYIIRNKLFIIKNYPKYASEYHYRFYLVILILQKCFSKKFIENIKIIKEAFKDARLIGTFSC